ncbi:penicillin-binding protein 2 [Primorskyibacter aestuariivivens]|uniref:peptidoglycan D,D-transpeptidase FtsI family protein n=1 Tax=Primorskyibacter aestuariivivens TaxID=1888912 RepID=UPI00230168F5|nr:penicillin-binding protein 2 [Primorskyibacter aestuariivivens]MDA7427496.1 penicillin-binding protein 2 [Primorskyibacter aestuariivivens]
MIRTPLRPLARILEARQKGENPDAIERENIRLRHEEMRDKLRVRAEQRLLLLGIMFFCAFMVIGARMGDLAASEPAEPRAASGGASIVAQRADIVDRKGRILATNMETHSLYAHPQQMIEPERAAEELGKIFPEIDVADLKKRFTSDRKFLWVRKKLSPEQKQAVHDIGEPGLLFGPREMRLYPNGPIAAHVLGGTRFGQEGVHSAEVVGTAGIERFYDDVLRDPAREGAPLELSLDLTIQAAAEKVLYGGMKIMNAKGAAMVLMDAHSGEIVSLASLPDFDPNDRPLPATGNDPSISPLFNRAVQGVYELGSTFKIFASAQALDLGLVNPSTMIDIRGPLKWGKHKIRDFHNYGRELDVTRIIVKSSNIGTARLAQMVGATRQKEFLEQLGFLDITPVELQEAKRAKPLLPPNWSELSAMTISYGHGISTSPLHLAAGYAAIANGGYTVKPTLLRQNSAKYGPRVLSAQAAEASRAMLRLVVSHPDGTANFGDVPGYGVAGKTGTADKPKPTGGYYEDKVIATFASIFPISDPKYVLVLVLDEPEIHAAGELRRTAGWTAVPVAAEMIERLAPLLGLRPAIEPASLAGITLSSN